jgi:hypothetical protein
MKIIRVKDNYNGITLESGQCLFRDIGKAFVYGETVTVNFTNQKYLTAVFLNASIGYLSAIFRDSVLNELCIIGETEEQSLLIDRVLENSHNYWHDNNHKEAVDIAITKMSEEMSR